MPRYVILEHDHPILHWDLMLDTENGLRTWRLAAPPQPCVIIEAQLLGIHRRAYLDYEGPVSGGRGTVRRWDSGDYTVEIESAESLEITLEGSRCHGRIKITSGNDQKLTFEWLE